MFKFHGLLMMSMDLSDIALLNIKSSDFCSIVSRISIKDAKNLIQTINLTKKIEYYKTGKRNFSVGDIEIKKKKNLPP